MELNKRIRFLRNRKNLTQKELGKRLGVSAASIGYWETGAKNPSMAAIIALAENLGVTTDFLLGVSLEQDRDDFVLNNREMSLINSYRILDKYGKQAVDAVCAIEKSRIELQCAETVSKSSIEIAKKKPYRYIPRYTNPSAAGSAIPLDGDEFEMILADENVPEDADFAVRIQGNSMQPYINDGDTVYVKKDTELSVGDVGIFCVDGAMYCKIYYIDSERNLTLVSANPEFKNTNVYVSADSNCSVQCYGKVLLDCKTHVPDYIFN